VKEIEEKTIEDDGGGYVLLCESHTGIQEIVIMIIEAMP